MKQYKLETLKDVLDAVNKENVAVFLEDFHNWLALSIAIRDENKNGIVYMESLPVMNWIDDGKNEIKVTIREISTEEFNPPTHNNV